MSDNLDRTPRRITGVTLLAGALLSLLLLALAACSGDDDEVTPVPPTPTPAATPTPAETPTPVVTPTPPGVPGASCDPQSGGDPDVLMFLTDVRVAPHEGFDRIVFEFEPPDGQQPGRPFFQVEFTDPPLIDHPRGMEIDVDGTAFLEVTIWSTGVDLSGPEPDIIYQGPERFQPADTAVVRDVRQAGDFEATMWWYVGLDEEACFHARVIDDPVRIVIDVESAPD